MENRSNGHEDRNESALYQPAAASTSDVGSPLSGEELHLLIDFFRLLDRWDGQEVVE